MGDKGEGDGGLGEGGESDVGNWVPAVLVGPAVTLAIRKNKSIILRCVASACAVWGGWGRVMRRGCAARDGRGACRESGVKERSERRCRRRCMWWSHSAGERWHGGAARV